MNLRCWSSYVFTFSGPRGIALKLRPWFRSMGNNRSLQSLSDQVYSSVLRSHSIFFSNNPLLLDIRSPPMSVYVAFTNSITVISKQLSGGSHFCVHVPSIFCKLLPIFLPPPSPGLIIWVFRVWHFCLCSPSLIWVLLLFCLFLPIHLFFHTSL